VRLHLTGAAGRTNTDVLAFVIKEFQMRSILDQYKGMDERSFQPGEIMIVEGESSGRLFVLIDGAVEVFRGDETGGEVEIALVSEPGSIFGEMSMLLDLPHTASVRATTNVRAFVVDNAAAFLRARPEIALPVAKLLARRLHAATSYLVDLKQQFEGFENHFGMVDEVLQSLTHQQDDDFMPVDELPSDPDR